MKILKLPCTTHNDLFGTNHMCKFINSKIYLVKDFILYKFNEFNFLEPSKKLAFNVLHIVAGNQNKLFIRPKDNETHIYVYDIASKKIEQNWYNYPDAIYMMYYSNTKIFSKSYYSHSDNHDPDDMYLMCFDKSTFKMLWEYRFDCEFEYALDGKRLYILDSKHNLMCWDKDSREVIWKNSYKDFNISSLTPEAVESESPHIYENHLIVQIHEGNVLGFDKATGKLLWQTGELEKRLVFGGNKGYSFNNWTLVLTVFDLKTGQILEDFEVTAIKEFKTRYMSQRDDLEEMLVTETHLWFFFNDGNRRVSTSVIFALNLGQKNKIDWHHIIKGGSYKRSSLHALNNRIYFSLSKEAWPPEGFSYCIEGDGGYIDEKQYTLQKTEEINNAQSERLQPLFKAPFAVFYAIASVSGVIDEIKIAHFMNLLKEQLESDYSLVVSLVKSALKNSTDYLAMISNNELDADTVLTDAKELLLSEFAYRDYEAYIIFLNELADKTAQPTGGFLGFGKKISEAELDAIQGVKALLSNNNSLQNNDK